MVLEAHLYVHARVFRTRDGYDRVFVTTFSGWLKCVGCENSGTVARSVLAGQKRFVFQILSNLCIFAPIYILSNFVKYVKKGVKIFSKWIYFLWTQKADVFVTFGLGKALGSDLKKGFEWIFFSQFYWKKGGGRGISYF